MGQSWNEQTEAFDNLFRVLKSEVANACRFLNAIQTNAQHLVRYLAVAAVVNKRRRNVMKDLMRLIEQESYQVSDPVTDFLQCLFTNYDFDGAQQKLQECEQVIATAGSLSCSHCVQSCQVGLLLFCILGVRGMCSWDIREGMECSASGVQIEARFSDVPCRSLTMTIS